METPAWSFGAPPPSLQGNAAQGMRFHARSYQKNFRGAFTRHEFRRYYQVWHRQAGKDDCAFCTVMFDLILQDANGVIGDYVYTFPEFEHGKKALWEKVCGHNIRLIEHVPEAARAGRQWLNEATMKLWLRNGTSLQVVGARYPDKLRGPSYKGVVVSESARCNPGIDKIYGPMLDNNGGWRIDNTTPAGKNHAYEDWLRAQIDPTWWSELLTIDDTRRDAPDERDHPKYLQPLMLPGDLDRLRKEGWSEEWIRQEYYCSWVAPMDGSIHGRLMERARNDRRIGIVPHDPNLGVITGWDIHNTAIWFAQVAGPTPRIIDYEFIGGQTFQEIVPRLFDGHRRAYVYEMHFFPADMNVRDYTAQDGRTRLDLAKQLLGETRVMAPKQHSGIQDRISGAQWLIARAHFDEVRCAEGIKALESYHREFDEERRRFRDNPEKDWASHGADAFGELGLHIQQDFGKSKPSRPADDYRGSGGGRWMH